MEAVSKEWHPASVSDRQQRYDRPATLFDSLCRRARADGLHVIAHCDVGHKDTREHIKQVVSTVAGTGLNRIDHGLNERSRKAEATISPAFLYITTMWYTRSEVPTRTGIWFAGNSLGGVITSFLAHGFGHVKNPLEPWQWMFIVLEQRVIHHGTGKAKHVWKPAQILECFVDPKTLFFFAISLLTQIPNGGTQNFGNLVLKGFGFTSLQTTLVTLPSSFISFFCIMGTGRLAGAFGNVTLFLICAVVLCPVAGSAIIYATGPSQGVKLFGYYLLSTGPSALPLSMSLVGVNYKGSTKKMTMTALLFLA
ncbi:hypothetical protein AC579_2970 [Pseudocercospora musae]|uniref:Major facilitator superfamily (MFS) profile domain-containing protein n=1 Tax=Pseudocercospora musae TaxID=113226 RepID=A0A139I855_9PEZI|nr:hypothetical protein AC579_2970 [Pseudocercospora musae]